MVTGAEQFHNVGLTKIQREEKACQEAEVLKSLAWGFLPDVIFPIDRIQLFPAWITSSFDAKKRKIRPLFIL